MLELRVSVSDIRRAFHLLLLIAANQTLQVVEFFLTFLGRLYLFLARVWAVLMTLFLVRLVSADWFIKVHLLVHHIAVHLLHVTCLWWRVLQLTWVVFVL